MMRKVTSWILILVLTTVMFSFALADEEVICSTGEIVSEIENQEIIPENIESEEITEDQQIAQNEEYITEEETDESEEITEGQQIAQNEEYITEEETDESEEETENVTPEENADEITVIEENTEEIAGIEENNNTFDEIENENNITETEELIQNEIEETDNEASDNTEAEEARLVITSEIPADIGNYETTASEEPAVVIVCQPSDIYTEIGSKVTFAVVAQNVVSYQWSYSRNNGSTWRNTSLSGNQTASLRITAKEEYFSYLWKCSLTDAQGNVTETTAVQLKLPENEEDTDEESGIVIISQPCDICKDIDEKATFSVNAINVVSYQWVYSRNNGTSWRLTTLSGNQTATLSVKVKIGYHDYIWKCQLTDRDGNVIETETVRILAPEVPEEFEIIGQPVDTIVEPGEKTHLTVVATGVSSYQWVYSRNNGESWRNTTLTGNQTASLTLTGRDAYYTYIWKCILTDRGGNMIETEAVRIVKPVVILPVSIKEQPHDVSSVAGQRVYFGVEAENAVSYSWMISDDQGNNWTTMTGAEADTVSFIVTDKTYGLLYKCVLTDEAGETTDTAIVRVTASEASELIVVKNAPATQTAGIGDTVVFTANAENVETYAWLSSANKGTNWAPATDAGSNTANLSVVVTEETFNTSYKCVMVDTDGGVIITQPVGIEQDTGLLKIEKQPVSVTMACGETAVFSVKARNAASYQWQVFHNNEWTNITELPGCKTASISVQVITNRSTLKYRCLITGVQGDNLYSNIVGISILEQDIVINGDEVLMYDVPLYYQGKYNLCWDYSQQMVEDFTLGITHTDAEVDALCKERAVEEYGSDWNNGGLPTDESWDVIWDDEMTIENVYEALAEHGPLYLNYNNYSMGHMVVLTGIDLSSGTMYTNNPWRVEGKQTYDQFTKMFATGNYKVSYKLPLIYASWADWQ